MQRFSEKNADFVGAGVVVGGLPLLAFMVLFFNLTAARKAGHPGGGDAVGLAIMSLFAYGLALLSLVVGAAYFRYKRIRDNLLLKPWHWMALALSVMEVIVPILYFSLL